MYRAFMLNNPSESKSVKNVDTMSKETSTSVAATLVHQLKGKEGYTNESSTTSQIATMATVLASTSVKAAIGLDVKDTVNMMYERGNYGEAKTMVHESFKEYETVCDIIESLPNIYQDQISVELAHEKYLFIIDQYQEQPHLLDKYLEPLLTKLLAFVRNPKSADEVKHLAFKFMYIITKTTGYKVVVRMMPHEVEDVEPVLALLALQNKENFEKWESRYMLLLWLSMVCMIPFDMARFDGNRTGGEADKLPIMDRIINAGKSYMDSSDKSRDAASYMLAKFMTRPDVRDKKLAEFLDWSLQTVHNAVTGTATSMTTSTGVLTTLALLFKHGKRNDLLQYAPVILKTIIQLKLNENANTNIRKLGVKLVTRLGLTFLKARLAAWRYQRGSRSLAENLSSTSSSMSAGGLQGNTTITAASAPQRQQQQQEEQEEEYDVPDDIEDVIEYLLSSLKDPNTIVRWSGAKGVGRITGRLPQELADEVVGSLMELFSPLETDVAWHGGCLSLAELGRRGLLITSRLPDVVPVIINALCFDEKRGNFSVGTHVRDAACYISWAFARAYDPKDLAPYVNQIANALVICFIFDREVQVRRASAAAFQENVGRQGQFPHGIDILTTCDYFAVGNRNSCYLELSVYVSQFEEYRFSLIEHVATVKSCHWDREIRILASQSLHNLTATSPQYIASQVIKPLMKKCVHDELNVRHGSVLAVAEIIHALYKIAVKENQNLDVYITSEVFTQLRELVTKLSEANLFKGVGGELMRIAVCCFIEKLSVSKITLDDGVIEAWQWLIDDSLLHIEPDVQKAAVSCIPAFFQEYYSTGDNSEQIKDRILKKYLANLKHAVETTRIGYAQAMGALPQFMLKGQLDVIMARLIDAMAFHESAGKYAESRKEMVVAFTNLALRAGVDKTGAPCDVLCTDNLQMVYDTLFTAFSDYSLDSRGDVGAWVREAAMSSIHLVTQHLVKYDAALLTPQIVEAVFCSVIQQAMEKIDRTRAHAGLIFEYLLYNDPPIPHIPEVEALKKIFNSEVISTMNWAVPSQTFPLFVQLLSLPVYKYSVMLGLVVSVGGLSESLVKHSTAALLSYLKDIASDKQAMSDVADMLLLIMKRNHKKDRVTLPLLKTLDTLIANDSLNVLFSDQENDLPTKLVDACKLEMQMCSDPHKILAAIDVLCDLLQFPGSVAKKCLGQITIYMCHKYPVVRKKAANHLFETLIMLDDDGDEDAQDRVQVGDLMDKENLDRVQELLVETQWDEPIDAVRPVRNELCDLFIIPQPVLKKKTTDKTA